MARYIEKPQEYEACQIGNDILMPEWFKTAVNKGFIMFQFNDNNELIAKVNNDSIANFGDYILFDPTTGLHVFTKDYFESHYQINDSD